MVRVGSKGWFQMFGPKIVYQDSVKKEVGSYGLVQMLGPKVGSHCLVQWLCIKKGP